MPVPSLGRDASCPEGMDPITCSVGSRLMRHSVDRHYLPSDVHSSAEYYFLAACTIRPVAPSRASQRTPIYDARQGIMLDIAGQMELRSASEREAQTFTAFDCLSQSGRKPGQEKRADQSKGSRISTTVFRSVR